MAAVTEQLVWWLVECSGVDETTARAALTSWDVVDYGGAAAILHDGPEIHLFVAPEWRNRLLRRDNVRQYIQPLLDKHGFLTTRLPVGSHNSRFVEKLGFKRTWSDGAQDYYMLTEAPFERRQHR